MGNSTPPDPDRRSTDYQGTRIGEKRNRARDYKNRFGGMAGGTIGGQNLCAPGCDGSEQLNNRLLIINQIYN